MALSAPQVHTRLQESVRRLRFSRSGRSLLVGATIALFVLVVALLLDASFHFGAVGRWVTFSLILTPALVAAIMVIAMGARFVDAREDTSSAAFAAARAASLTTNQEAAVAAGRTAARQSMSDRGQSCTSLAVTIDAHDFIPGGTIRATVTCVADLSDLSGFGIGSGHKTFTATAAVPLEQHRDFS